MKKIVCLLALALTVATQAKAESIVVIDQNGTVVRQIMTSPDTYTTTTTTTTATTTPAQTVTVVRESPVVQNSYYYDSGATNAAVAAGVTTAVVGSLLLGRPHHGGGFAPAPAPHGGIGRPIGGPGHRR
jgi:hypothetical protein